ncbi:MAG: hypothetical protein F7C33_00440 [Desulfurococcales archaeon]|nr:hypothetical protein [Desulfurococcales archaeon]
MITEVLPCNEEEALELLVEARDWLYKRARLSAAIGGLASVISLLLSLLGPPLLLILGVFSSVALATVTLWLYRGNKELGEDVESFTSALRAGGVSLQDYCDLPLITAVVAFKLKRTGGIASKGESGGKSGRIPSERYQHSLPEMG